MEDTLKYVSVRKIKPQQHIGTISLVIAIVGFVFSEFQPFFDLKTIVVGSVTVQQILRSFFEASLVGALADWYAITVLFKSPLGIRLPHTDILYKKKDQIAEAVPAFLSSFVSNELLRNKVESIDAASVLSQLYSLPETEGKLRAFVRTAVLKLLDSPVQVNSFAMLERIGHFIAKTIDGPELVLYIFRWCRQQKYDEKFIEQVAQTFSVYMYRNSEKLAEILTPIFKRSMGWQALFTSQTKINTMLLSLSQELGTISKDKNNEVRRFVLAEISIFLEGTSKSKITSLQSTISNFGKSLLTNENFKARLIITWNRILARLKTDLAAPPTPEDTKENIVYNYLGRALTLPEFRSFINNQLHSLLLMALEESNIIKKATALLADLIKKHDTRLFVKRVENSIWHDLQYIRLNGAVVGGLVGLLLLFIKSI